MSISPSGGAQTTTRTNEAPDRRDERERGAAEAWKATLQTAFSGVLTDRAVVQQRVIDAGWSQNATDDSNDLIEADELSDDGLLSADDATLASGVGAAGQQAGAVERRPSTKPGVADSTDPRGRTFVKQARAEVASGETGGNDDGQAPTQASGATAGRSRLSDAKASTRGEAPSQVEADGHRNTNQAQPPAASSSGALLTRLANVGARSGEGARGVERVDGAAKGSPTGIVSKESIRGGAKSTNGASKPQQPLKYEEQDEALMKQVSRGVAQLMRRGGGKLTLRLNPTELGAVRVHLTVQEGGFEGVVEASSDSARSLLERRIDELRAALESRGLEVRRLVVSREPWEGSGSIGTQNGSPGAESRADESPWTGDGTGPGREGFDAGNGATDGGAGRGGERRELTSPGELGVPEDPGVNASGVEGWALEATHEVVSAGAITINVVV